MNRTLVSAASVLACWFASSALAQTTIVQWDFNLATPTFNPSIGAGTMTLVGGTAAVVNTGSPQDAGVPNNAFSISNYPAQGTGDGTAGVDFLFSTVGFEGIRFACDERHSNTSARHSRIRYSVDGGQTFIDGPLFETPGGDTWNLDRILDLTGVQGASNNPALHIRVVAAFDPEMNPPGYSPSRRPPATPEYLPGGNHRIDFVRVTGTAVVSVPPQGSGSFAPTAVCRGGQTTLTVSASPGQNPLSHTLTVIADLSMLGGSASQVLDFQGGSTFATTVTVAEAAATGFVAIPITVSDETARSSTASTTLAIGDCSANSDAPVVISMINGGGGNAGSIFNADFVEIFNRSCGAVSLHGWSLQYTSAGGANTFDGQRQINLSGTIQPGQYLLIQTERIDEGDPGLPIPAPDFLAFPANPDDLPVPPQTSNGFGLGNDAGRVALVSSTDPIGADCAHSAVVDLVGYGATAFCYEGVAPTGNGSNTISIIRKDQGCLDSDQGFNDFDATFPRDPFNSVSQTHVCSDCPAPCRADFNGDGLIFPDDLSEFITCFFLQVQFPGFCARADFNGDGLAFPDDLSEFITTFFLSVQFGC